MQLNIHEEINMRKIVVLLLLLSQPFSQLVAKEIERYQMPRTQVVPINDSKLDRQYELYIKLPQDYGKNTEVKYPVIYTTDAVWQIELLSGVTEFLMPKVILVGISWQKDMDENIDYGELREFASRFRDYNIIQSTNAEHQAKYKFGQASHHLDFVRNDVIKYVEKHYRVDPKQRSYIGYSLGGHFGAYTLIAKPNTFKNYILGSPAFSERSIKYIDELEGKTAPKQANLKANVFVSLGGLETSEADLTNRLVSILKRRTQSGLSLTGLEIIQDSDHS